MEVAAIRSLGQEVVQLKRERVISHQTSPSPTEIISQDHYVDVEIGRSERVAVCGGEVTGVVGDVDVAVIADLRWKAPFQKS